MIEISGSTRIFPVIACPVEQVRAPVLFNAYFARHDIDARVVPLKVEPDKYIATVRNLMAIENVGGIFVSIPHKPTSIAAVDEASPRASVAGAANVIYRDAGGKLHGDLIDGEGFVRALDRTRAGTAFDYRQASALVVGSGGVGAAVAAALAARGIGRLAIFDTRLDAAAALCRRLQTAFGHTQFLVREPSAAGYDLVVNCTPFGMHDDDPLPIDLAGVAPSCIVADCGMKIEMTRLLREAEARGCRIQKGKEMLIEQAPLYLELFGWDRVSADDFRVLEAI